MPRILTLTLNPALDLATDVAQVTPDLKLRCAPARTDPGGGGLNVARAIIQLGGAAHALAALGGATGEAVASLARARGVPLEELHLPHDTRQNLVVTETDTGHQYRFVLPGARWTAADCDAAMAQIRTHLRPGDWLVPSGSLPPGVPVTFMIALHTDLAPNAVRMLLDTSGETLRAVAEGQTTTPLWVLRMDQDEAETLAGQPQATAADTAAFGQQLRARGVAQTLLIARGAEGTVAIGPDGVWLCPAPQVPVLSRTGAGDSFVAGFLLASARGDDLPTACAFGVAAASSAVMTPDTALCERAKTEELDRTITPHHL